MDPKLNKMLRLKILLIIPTICCFGCIDSSQSLFQEESEEASTNLGKEIYDDHCFSCHTPGLTGAPRIGDEEVWTARLTQGREALLQSTIEGIQPAMPPRGICFECSDEELDEAIDYMINYKD